MDHNEGVDAVIRRLTTSKEGLRSLEAHRRLVKDGRNEIQKKKPVSPWMIFLSQFRNTMIYVLLGVTLVALLLREYIDSGVILVILVFIAVLGFFQEYKAERSIEALKKLASLKSKVLRDGDVSYVDSAEIVKGDVILLEAGDKVPADCRLMEVNNLRVDESMLTGESVAVQKSTAALKGKIPLANKTNMIFSGSVVTKGRGRAVVVRTAMDTEIGKIADMIQTQKDTQTPLQKKLDTVSRYLGVSVIAICIFVFVINIVRDPELMALLAQLELGSLSWYAQVLEGMKEILMAAVSLGVAAIPEGLPAVVTVALSIGVTGMVKRNALIRKLPSVETLGATTVICTDKTGTLTCNEMTVRKLYLDGKTFEVTGEGYDDSGDFFLGNKKADPKALEFLLRIGCLNNDSHMQGDKYFGDPTELALLVSGQKGGLEQESLNKSYPRIDEIPFDSTRKRMSTVHKHKGKKYMFVKGAPDIVLCLCSHVHEKGRVKKLTPESKKKIIQVNEEYAGEALRVLGFAYKEVNGDKGSEENLVFVGLQGMMDPPRPEARGSIERCKSAGIRVIMITGDYIKTAEAIGRHIGLEGKAMTGSQLEKVKDLGKVLDEYSIFARVNPEHKMRIVDTFQKKGQVVAMTGDGVNDAPALKKADIGVAMGITGTDVSKEASDMILLDDNFTSIVNAVEQGRGIDDNIKKFVNYLLTSNAGEVLVMLVVAILGITYAGDIVIPLLAVQLLWMNLVTDGFPAMALGVDPVAKDVMKRPPRNPKDPIISRNMIMNICVLGILIAVFGIYLFRQGLSQAVDDPVGKARTMLFTGLVVFEFVRVYMIRSEYKVGIFTNKYLIGAIILSICLQMLVVYVPFMQVFFKTVALSLIDWLHIAAAAAVMLVVGMMSGKAIQRLTHEMD